MRIRSLGSTRPASPGERRTSDAICFTPRRRRAQDTLTTRRPGKIWPRQGAIVMKTHSAVSRRFALAGGIGLLASPAIRGRAAAATRGVSDTEIIIGTMTDLSGVTAVQGTNAANSIRMAFDDVNAKGGINGRKIRFIVEDMEYQVPKAVQAMNKLVNRDNIFLSISSGGTPQMDAVLPMMLEKGVPSVFPSTCARSMYSPFNKLKYGQFSSYYDQMRACVKYFADLKGKKVIGSMYQDTDFGRDVHAGVVAQVEG